MLSIHFVHVNDRTKFARTRDRTKLVCKHSLRGYVRGPLLEETTSHLSMCVCVLNIAFRDDVEETTKPLATCVCVCVWWPCGLVVKALDCGTRVHGCKFHQLFTLTLPLRKLEEYLRHFTCCHHGACALFDSHSDKPSVF